MAKAIKTALIATAIAVAVVATGGALLPAAAAMLLPSLTTVAIMTFASTLITAGIGMMTSKGIEANSGNFGTKATTRGAIKPRQIIYGETIVGGVITFLRTTGTDNHKLSLMVVFAGHEVEEFTSLQFNDTIVTTSAATSSGAGTDNKIYTVTDADFTNTDNENNFGSGRLARFTFHDGSQTAHDSLARTTHGSTVIDNNFILSGCAYMYLEMIYDPEKLPQVPKIAMKIKGKKLYDPRLDTTVGGSGSHRLATPSTHAWSDNPALCILDYLSDTTYGLKATSTELNLSANAGGFMSAANTCEQTVSNIGGVSEERYTANGFTNMSADGTGVIEGLLSACGGKLTFTNGMFNVFVAAAQTPSLTITDDDLLEPVNLTKNTQSNELFNSVKAIFVDKDNNFQATDTPELTNSTFVSEDVPSGETNANYLKRMEVQLPYTQTNTTAERLAKIALQHQRKTLQLSTLTTTKFMRLQPADFVYVTNERLNFTNKMFEVISTNLEFKEVEEAPVAATRLVLKEIDAATYDFVSNDYVTPITQGPVTEVPAGSFEMSQPSSLSLSQVLTLDGTTSKINIKASWTNSTSPYLFGTEVSYKLSTDSAYQAIVVGAGTSQAFIPNVTAGDQYNVRVRHFSDRNVYSAYTSNVNITIAAASAAPSDPSNLSATTGKAFNIVVSYTNPNNSDLKAVKIYRKTTNSTPSSDSDGLINTQYGSPNSVSTFVDGKASGLTAGVTYYYWVRAVNHSDVHSNFVGSVQGNFTNVNTPDLVDDAITTVKIDDDAITAPKISVATLSAITADVGTLTAGTINGTNMSILNLDAGNITTGNLNANNINLNGTTLTVTSNGLQIGTFDGVSHGNAGTIGAVIADQGTHTMTNTATSSSSTSFHIPERLTTPLTLSVPATKTAETKTFLIRLNANPAGTAVSSTAINVVAGYATTNNQTAISGLGSNANQYINGIFAECIAVSHRFTITTSTASATTVYIYGFAGLIGVSSPAIQYTLSVEGVFR